ncbi:methyltransferase [Parasalinivibrio latis]|uniref:methyltransferase n=1 Tax=Parasalinivibrio latis TaxID=2952610 RepID=UPI0030E2C47E
MNSAFSLLGVEFTLNRFPIRQKETFQAWDASDEYLIEHVETCLPPKGSRILILNDNFGALSCWFASKGYSVTLVSDSFIAHEATRQNLLQNGLGEIEHVDCLAPFPEDSALVLLRLPKSQRLLSWQLSKLSKDLPTGIPVVGTAKARDIHTSTLKLVEEYLAPCTTSLAKKKSRLVFCETAKNGSSIPETTSFSVPEFGMTLHNHASVFAGQKLDIAAYLMLPHIPQDGAMKHIIDLGCGNGVLALQAARLNPRAKVTCVDESLMAVTSAKLNMQADLGPEVNADWLANDCLTGFETNSADMVLCNPPFHQQHTVTDHIAWQMFRDAKRVLNKGGKFLVIGNRHLGYHAKLKRLFGSSRVIASNAKFVIIEAYK